MKVYRRPAEVIYPPVDVEKFAIVADKEDFYVTLSRLVPYKRVGVVVDAFAQMPQRRLLVVGDGPELLALKARASANVSFAGRVSHETKLRYLQNAKAYVFAGEEDFGIAMVEPQACGTPVIAFERGGAAEIVVNGETGLLFDEQSPEALVAAIGRFERMQPLEPRQIEINARRFGVARFRREFKALIDRVMELTTWPVPRRAVNSIIERPDALGNSVTTVEMQ